MTGVRGRDVHISEPAGGAAYAALPDDAKHGVVVIHEIFGRQPEIDRVVDRFSRSGFAAVAPDLFHGRFFPLCIRAAMRSIRAGAGPHIDQIVRAREWLCAESGISPERVGLIGFCLGGGFALSAGRGWAAVSTNYGDVPSAEILRGIGPVIGCYGGRDPLFARNADVLRERLHAAGAAEPEVHVFPHVGHSFLTDGHHPIGSALSYPLLHVRYDPTVAEDAWTKIIDFFGRNLGPA